MGSRFMHLLVADYVANELGIEQRDRMLLGSIAPDAAIHKGEAHFKGKLHRYAYNSPIDFGRFVIKYRTKFSDAFFIGYLTHLVTDDIWTMKTDFTGFEQRLKKDPELYGIYHGDLWLCNAKLNEAYHPDGVYESLMSANEVPKIEELDEKRVLEYKLEALADFQYPPENLSKPLRLFTFEEMVHYLERSMSNALDVCRIVLLT